MNERQVAVVVFLIADKELSEAVEPAMADLDHPPPALWRSSPALLVSLGDAGEVPARRDSLECRVA